MEWVHKLSSVRFLKYWILIRISLRLYEKRVYRWNVFKELDCCYTCFISVLFLFFSYIFLMNTLHCMLSKVPLFWIIFIAGWEYSFRECTNKWCELERNTNEKKETKKKRKWKAHEISMNLISSIRLHTYYANMVLIS